MFDDNKSLKKVSNREEFSKFAKALSDDFYTSPQSWINRDIHAYLNALITCLESSEKKESPTWQSFADLLLCAKTRKK